MTHRIDVLVFPDFQILDATGPVAAFEMPNSDRIPPLSGPAGIHLGGAVRSRRESAYSPTWDDNVNPVGGRRPGHLQRR